MNVISIARKYLDQRSEREAEKLLEADVPTVHRWKLRVTHNIDKRRGRKANLAHLRIERARRQA